MVSGAAAGGIAGCGKSVDVGGGGAVCVCSSGSEGIGLDVARAERGDGV